MMAAKKKKLPPGCWLIADWRRSYRFISVQIMAVIAASQGLLTFMPTVKDFIPPWMWHSLMTILAVAAIIGRLVNQSSKK